MENYAATEIRILLSSSSTHNKKNQTQGNYARYKE
jgi:hypothetical protein